MLHMVNIISLLESKKYKTSFWINTRQIRHVTGVGDKAVLRMVDDEAIMLECSDLQFLTFIGCNDGGG